MIRSVGGTGPTGTSSPTEIVRYWPSRSSNAIPTWVSMPAGSNRRPGLPATTSTSPTGSTHSIITASRRSNGCSRSASSVAGDFFQAGLQRLWIYRPTFSFPNRAQGKSKVCGCANQSNSFMTRCPAPATFSKASAISDFDLPRDVAASALSHRHDEYPRKPQQHLAVGLWQIARHAARGVFREIGFAFGRIQRIDERPQAASLDPFHDRGGIVEHVVIDRVPDLQPAAERAQRIVIDARLRKRVADACGLSQRRAPRLQQRDLAHQDMGRLIEIVGHLHRKDV